MKKLMELIKRLLGLTSKTGCFWIVGETDLSDYE
jgi:hypothetical protein